MYMLKHWMYCLVSKLKGSWRISTRTS